MRLTLGRKLELGFGSVLLLMVFTSFAGFLKTNEIRKSQDATIERTFPAIETARQLQRDLNYTQVKGRQAILSGTDRHGWEDATKAFDGAWTAVQSEIARLDQLSADWSQQDRDCLADIKRHLPALHTTEQAAIQHAASGKSNAVIRAGKENLVLVTPENIAVKKSVDSIADSLSTELARNKEELHKQNRSLNIIMMFTTLGALAIGIFVGLYLHRSITSASRSALGQAEAIAAGDLTRPELRVLSQDELGDLTLAINRMSGNLRKVVQTIAATAEQVASASEEISSGATQSAETAHTQTGQTQQIATAMQEMASTVEQVSGNSQKAADASHQAADAARHGGDVVQQTLTSMRRIADSTTKAATRIGELGKSSEQIGKIVSVIDDIADQTNLLALNAAIEAARAGEQGRGFAVVADEVRKLAERTTKATKEIADMIVSIQAETKSAVLAMELGSREVESGVANTTASGQALKEIIAMAEGVSDMVTQIATAATEQSSATEQINANVAQISSATAATSASAEQTAKACADLSGLAFDLQKVVGQFKLESGTSVQAAKKPATTSVPRTTAARAGR